MKFQDNIKHLLILLMMIPPVLAQAQVSLSTKNAKVSIFSSTPLEDIKASSKKGTAVFVPVSRDIAFLVPIKSFEFDKGLMQEHFNENYMESDKYPVAKFKGKLNQEIDYTRNGEHNVTVTGTLLVHGVEKPRTINGKIRVSDGQVQLLSAFDVVCADHNITIPKLVFTKVAQVIRVNVDASLNQSK